MLDEGDLVKADLEPVRGSEQGGYRPCLVITDRVFHETRSTAIICPITTNVSPWPTKIMLPDGLPISGAVLCEQLRLVSRSDRGFKYAGRVPFATLRDVRRVINDLLRISDTLATG
jgi:mRNA interferase MazF